jgi:transcriptional regulator with XRE-family HTH domain
MHDLPCSDNMKIDPLLLRQLREERSWTQEHLADAAGVSLRTVQRIEREGNASADSRLALAAAFGVDVSMLVGKTEEPSSPPVQPVVDDRPLETRRLPWARGGILRHLLVYLAVCSFLVYLDFSSGSSYHWSKWPLLGWGFGLVMHALSVWSKPSRSLGMEPNDKNRHKSFPDRLRIYLVMSVVFLAIDLLTTGRLTWAFYPILGWGAGLILSYGKAEFRQRPQV